MPYGGCASSPQIGEIQALSVRSATTTNMATIWRMVDWSDFARQAPRIAEVFVRRHTATGNLCLLATLRSDGYPRISPMEPRIFEGRLVLVGMPNTTKFRDLARDPRFSLHTATVDTHVGDGDAKVWGEAGTSRIRSCTLGLPRTCSRSPGSIFADRFDPFYVADLAGASSVEFRDGQLTITIWKPGEGERSAPLS